MIYFCRFSLKNIKQNHAFTRKYYIKESYFSLSRVKYAATVHFSKNSSEVFLFCKTEMKDETH